VIVAIRRTKVLLIALVTPVLAVALGVAVLHEHLGVRAFLGTALILGGVFLGLRGRVAPYRFFSNQSARR
jgi:drug/metabolite transporter (DMT)-like permease